MQILKVKRSGANTSMTVKVLRSWANSSGGNLFLHHNGVYGYKDGAPVMSEKELTDVIHAPVQLNLALRWWRSLGKKLSEDYYAAQQQAELSASSDFRPLDDGANSTLDMTMYRRRGVKTGSAVSGAKSWMEMGFPDRPDWWGQARLIEVGEWIYEREDEMVQNQAPAGAAKLSDLADVVAGGSGSETGA
jgi:hypothetical protein